MMNSADQLKNWTSASRFITGGMPEKSPMRSPRMPALITAVTRAGILGDLMGDFSGMPPVMKRLALVQFFSWSALFIMWIYTTPVVAQYVFRAPDPASAGYNAAGNWVGMLF